ncbi:MAG: NACHT domain-containing protein [Pseudonocardiaceae bacterium]
MGVLRSRRRAVVAGVGLLTTVAAATAWMLAQDTRGAELATVLGLPVAIAGLLVALIGTRSDSDSAEQLLLAARRLARDVRGLETGVLARLMADTGDPAPADLSFAQPAQIYWRTDGGDRRGTLNEVKAYYWSLNRGRLVVLGEPGAGKTILAIKLVLDLAAAVLATLDNVRPFPRVPVRLSLPSFDPGDVDSTTKVISTRLDIWLIQHLVTVFGLSGKVARALVTDGWILPVFDGLDEMDMDDTRPLRAAAVVRALNHTSAGGLRPVVITCRTSYYRQLSTVPDAVDDARPAEPKATQREVVQDATVVGVEPLTVQHMVDYLTYRFPDPANSACIESRWRPITDRISASRSGDPLVAALGSPLRLFLTVTSYHHDASKPDELTRLNTAGQIDDYLFVRLVPAVIEQHPPTGWEYSTATVTRWLTTLARHLNWQGRHGDSSSDLWLHLLWPAAGERAPRYTAAVLMATIAATPYLTVGVFGHWTVLYVFMVGTIVVVVAWRASRRTVDLRRLDLSALHTSSGRQRIRRLFVIGGKFWFKIGLAFGSPLGFAFGFAEEDLGSSVGLMTGLGVGAMLATAFGLAGGLTNALTTHPPAIDRPAQLVRQGVVHLAAVVTAVGLSVGLIVGLMLALLLSLLVGFMLGLTSGLVNGLEWVLVFGVPVGFLFVANSPWPRYMVATMILARRGDLPRRPAVFLNWAYGAGLIRMSGIAVQFRHREFQTWLTTRD